MNTVVHFEVIGKHPIALRRFYTDLFGWAFDTTSPVASAVSDPGDYGFVQGVDGGINGGVGGGPGFDGHVTFYAGVPDVEAALAQVERLGGVRVFGPIVSPGGSLVVGKFADPEGNVIGVAGPK